MNRLPFSQLPIDRSEILQSDLNIDNRSRTNLFAWNGQFSPQFVEVILDKYCDANSKVLDPFSGSGTVLGEAARLGIESYGVELNPAPYYMSKTYELCTVEKLDRDKALTDITNSIYLAIQKDDILQALNELHASKDGVAKDILNIYYVLLDLYNHELTTEWVLKQWYHLCQIIDQLPVVSTNVTAYLGDARHIPLHDNSIDFVLTSPPYINVFNYHQKYRRSVENIGFDVLKIAKAEIGANRKYRSNRLFTVVQYCIDMALVIKELLRLCNEKARIVFVIGRESTVLGCSFCNSELIYNLFSDIFSCNLLLRQERVFKNRYGQMIYEDILHFDVNKETVSIPNSDIVAMARNVAQQALQFTHEHCDSSATLTMIDNALQSIMKIEKSEEVYT